MELEHSAGSGSYQVVARRYRPKDFNELVGQTHIAHALSNAITSGRIGHAYLFTGARGVGKTSTARIYAKALNCETGSTLTPCGICDSCISISTGDDIDVLEIDAASNRGIEEIRQLRQNASIRPSRSRFKIYILDEVHMLTKEAFNALLKILEEPPGHVKFIFCTTEPNKIPITILSRCQRFDFAGIDARQIADRLASIAQNEHITAEEGVFATLARRAAGSMRDAQSLLEQLLSFAPEHISLSDVHDMLGTANDQLLFRLLDSITRNTDGGQTAIFTELDAAASQGVDFGVLSEQMLGLFRDLLVAASGGDANLLLTCSPQQFDHVKTLASELGIHRILAAMQILDHTHTRMQRSTQGRILIELALVRIANLDHFHQVAELLEQLRLSSQTPDGQRSERLTVKPAQRMIAPPPPSVSALSPSVTALPSAPARPVSVLPVVLSLTDAKAHSIWFDAMESIPGSLGTAAMQCKSIRFESPNVFAAFFDNQTAKEMCEKDAVRLQNVLSQTLGQAVKVHLEVEQPQPQSTDSEHYKAVAENPLTLKIQTTFGITLDEVKR